MTANPSQSEELSHSRKDANPPTLIAAYAHFCTYDDDKRPNTWLEGFVNFSRGGRTRLAAYMEQEGVHFPERSFRDIPLRIEDRTMTKLETPGSSFLIRLTPRGNTGDDWQFIVHITLSFSDGSMSGGSAGIANLNDTNRREIAVPLFEIH
jgi:hypothetical protein